MRRRLVALASTSPMMPEDRRPRAPRMLGVEYALVQTVEINSSFQVRFGALCELKRVLWCCSRARASLLREFARRALTRRRRRVKRRRLRGRER